MDEQQALTPKVEINSPKKKKKAKNLVTWILGIFVGVLLLFEGVGLISARSNYGVPNYFGYQMMNVLTDSMVPDMPVGSGIIVKKVDLSTLKASTTIEAHDGDIISFYKPTEKIVVSHRIIAIQQNSDGSYVFDCLGDNLEAESCYSNFGHACSISDYDIVPEKYVLGKVIVISMPLGTVYKTMTSVYVFPIIVLIPLIWVFVSAIQDIVKAAKMPADGPKNVENDNIEEEDEEFIAMKEQEKMRLMVEMEKEKLREELKKGEEVKDESTKKDQK